MSLEWLFKNGKNFSHITPIVSERADDFYKSEFMNYLLKEFWTKEQKRIRD